MANVQWKFILPTMPIEEEEEIFCPRFF